jgi:mannose-6-phosphate isomerase-like protein (cupin superfamily)
MLYMSEPTVVVRNWREPDPHVGHESAIIWSIFRQRNAEKSAPHSCLEHLTGLVKHALQGGQNSNLHQHDQVEQFYYVLKGSGEVLIGEERFPVCAGSAAYLPPAVPHQFFAAPEEGWVEHLVVSCPVKREGSSSARVVNWREVQPETGNHGAAVGWPLLEAVDEPEPVTGQPCLLGFYYLTRQGLVRGKAADRHTHDDKEQVYYVTEGWGTMIAGDEIYRIGEGDVVYLPREVPHQILNEDCDGWLSYLIIS